MSQARLSGRLRSTCCMEFGTDRMSSATCLLARLAVLVGLAFSGTKASRAGRSLRQLQGAGNLDVEQAISLISDVRDCDFRG